MLEKCLLLTEIFLVPMCTICAGYDFACALLRCLSHEYHLMFFYLLAGMILFIDLYVNLKATRNLIRKGD